MNMTTGSFVSLATSLLIRQVGDLLGLELSFALSVYHPPVLFIYVLSNIGEGRSLDPTDLALSCLLFFYDIGVHIGLFGR